MPIYEGILASLHARIAQDIVTLTCEMGALKVSARIHLEPDWNNLIALLDSAYDQHRELAITYEQIGEINYLLSVYAPGSPQQGEKYILVRNLPGPIVQQHLEQAQTQDDRPERQWSQRLPSFLRSK